MSKKLYSENLIREFAGSLRQQEAKVMKIEIPVADTDPLSWLAGRPSGTRFYLKTRESGEEIAATGNLLSFRGADAGEMETWLRESDTGIRFYGGLPFYHFSPDAENPDRVLFFLPAVELKRSRQGTILQCNFRLDLGLSAEEVIRQIAQAQQSLSDLRDPENPAVARGIIKAITPTREEWKKNIAAAKKLIREGVLNKIVMARKVTVETALDAFAILRSFASSAEKSTHFLFQHNGGPLFFGRSPEILYTRRDRKIETEALAGSGDGSSELTESSKDMHEHGYVVFSIEEKLKGLCIASRRENLGVLKLDYINHLLQKFSGDLREGLSDFRILEQLHPSPALGGYPRKEALDFLRRHESFEREWYGSPIGFVSEKEAYFCVGIRSAEKNGGVLHLFTGAGIVADSDADREWNELNLKLRTFENVLRMDAGSIG